MNNCIIRLLVSLYPRSWRQRYGAEFAQLLEELPGRWTDVADVLVGALKMSLSRRSGTEAGAYAIVALTIVWSTSQSAVCGAAVRLAALIFPMLGVPVVQEADLLLLATHQLSGLSMCQGTFGVATLCLLSIFHFFPQHRRFATQLLLLWALIPAGVLGYATRIVVTGLLVEADLPSSIVAFVGPVSFVLTAIVSFSGIRWASWVAASVPGRLLGDGGNFAGRQ